MTSLIKPLFCDIYRCSKKEGMYIYLEKSSDKDKDDKLNALPEPLKQTTGRMELAMTLAITPDKKLARANAQDVLTAIKDKGFYLQMPPTLSSEAQATSDAINDANSKLER